ncbi:hypothetical protein LAUMK13_05745 [Mycobacterium innocens]|uniref:Uncharacterized protein n=1 Tax=Mycobacterium innocens TaxID=2341083 RepID=A0A498QMJ1_9MYCO|nr:hypothetical protein LAUMK13_05745 [Mycobacterium innocens]
MGHAGITVTADTYADEQFDGIAVRLTRWLTFRQTATRSRGPISGSRKGWCAAL